MASVGRRPKGKPKRRKRETNAERAAREFERRRMSFIAVDIADAIRRRSKDKTDSPAREAGERFIGLSICDYCENVPKLLRLVADLLEGKPPLYSPGNDRYDGLIKGAYLEACNRMPPPRENQDDEGYEMDDGKIIIRCPYFSEFLDIFRKQNPKLQGVSDSSVRRSLQRLGYPLTPAKLGRPEGATDLLGRFGIVRPRKKHG